MSKLFKYQIGLAALGLFAASMAIVLFVQAGAVKNDTQTFKAAEKVAVKLDDYIYDKQEIPESLTNAKISEENPNISYKKVSNEKYEFCVTYRAKGNGTGGTALLTSVIFGDPSDYYDENSEPSSTYIDPYYDKGENCQTVTPYFYEEQSYEQPQEDYITFSDEAIVALNEVTEICANTLKHDDAQYHACMKSAYNAYY